MLFPPIFGILMKTRSGTVFRKSPAFLLLIEKNVSPLLQRFRELGAVRRLERGRDEERMGVGAVLGEWVDVKECGSIFADEKFGGMAKRLLGPRGRRVVRV